MMGAAVAVSEMPSAKGSTAARPGRIIHRLDANKEHATEKTVRLTDIRSASRECKQRAEQRARWQHRLKEVRLLSIVGQTAALPKSQPVVLAGDHEREGGPCAPSS
jgi:hypothetical protein